MCVNFGISIIFYYCFMEAIYLILHLVFTALCVIYWYVTFVVCRSLLLSLFLFYVPC